MSFRNVSGARAQPARPLPALVLALALGLSACAGAPAVPTASPAAEQPSPAATSTPAPLPTAPATAEAPAPLPTEAPAATPEPGALLPAPLVYLSNGQLHRLETDGATSSQLTNEPAPAQDAAAITAFDVSPADGSLIYLAQRPGANGLTSHALILVGADGANRRELLTSAYLTPPRFSPDGARIAFGVVPHIGAEHSGPAAGVYLVDVAGGQPQLVQPSGSFVTIPAPAGARAYAPSGWSPDGARLALQAFLPATEFCETAVKDLATDALVTPQAPEGLVTSCRNVTWSADSRTAYVPIYQPGMFGAFAGLAQVDATTGELTVPLSNKIGETWIGVSGLNPLSDGGFQAFVATGAAPIATDPTLPAPRYTLHTLGLDGSLAPLRGDAQLVWGGPYWAPDGRGAAILSSPDPSGQPELVWVPADGGPAVTLLGGGQAGEARWGR